MLSLVVVLSVYYLTGPDQKTSNVASSQEERTNRVLKQQNQKRKQPKFLTKMYQMLLYLHLIMEFDAIRLSIQDERSKIREDLTNKMGTQVFRQKKKIKLLKQVISLLKHHRQSNY